MNVRLFINYQEVELSKRDVIALSYGVNRLTDIQSRQGYYSNTFRLPKTATNLEIFGYPDQLNATDTKRWERLTSWVESDGVQVVYGFAQLQSIGNELEVVVKGGNSDIVDLIRDKDLSSLDLSTYNHVINLANVDANRFNDYTDGYVYPDVDYNYLRNLTNPIPYFFLFPAMFARPVLDKIITEAGYTMQGDILDIETFDKMVIPFSREFPRVSSAFRTANQFKARLEPQTLTYSGLPTPPPSSAAEYMRAVAGFDNDSTDGYFDNPSAFTLGSWDSITGGTVNPTPLSYYLPSIQTNQTIYFQCRIVVTGWTSGCRLTIGLSGDTYNQWQDSVYRHEDEADDNGTFDISLEVYQDDIPSGGNYVQVLLDGVTGPTYPDYPNAPSVEFVSGSMYNVVHAQHNYANDFQMSANLPDMKQSEFLKYIVNAFCLLIDTNPVTNTVTFSQFDNVPSNPPVDWSDKIDESEDETIVPNYGNYSKNNVLKYSNNTNDEALKTDPDYGEHTITSTYALEGEKTLYQSKFSASKSLDDYPTRMFIHYFDGEAREQAITDITIGNGIVTCESTEDMNEGDTVIFKDLNSSIQLGGEDLEGLKGATILEITSDTTFDLKGSTTGTAPTSGTLIHLIDADKTKDPKPRIAIHEVVDGGDVGLIQLINGTTVTQASQLTFVDLEFPNLYANHGVLLTSIIDSPQMVKQLIRLSALDINALDFSKPIWIDKYGCLFYLSYVDQFKTNQVDSTEVELVKLP